MIVISLLKKIRKRKKIDHPVIDKIQQEEINPIYNLESTKKDKKYDYYDYVDNAIERNKKTLN